MNGEAVGSWINGEGVGVVPLLLVLGQLLQAWFTGSFTVNTSYGTSLCEPAD